jgi:hypothetical protein
MNSLVSGKLCHATAGFFPSPTLVYIAVYFKCGNIIVSYTFLVALQRISTSAKGA